MPIQTPTMHKVKNLQLRPHNSLPLLYLTFRPVGFSFLQTAINLIYHVQTRIIIPRRASLLHNLWNLQIIDILGAFYKSHKQSLTQMPSNMTMEWPSAWIIRLELKYQVSERSEVMCISALGVGWSNDSLPVPGAIAV